MATVATMAASPHVGTLREKPLHAALKSWYAQPGDLIEEPVDGYVIDLVRGELLIEIQTRGFSSLKRKLPELLEHHSVRLVHPIAAQKWIVKTDERDVVISRRRSPKQGAVVDVFGELVSIPDLLDHGGFELEVMLVEMEEVWRFDGRRGRRRRGWVVDERRLVEVRERHLFESPADLATLLPCDLPESFTTAHLAEALDATRRLAQQMAYCMRATGVLTMDGKEGNAIVYRRAG